MLEVEHVSKSLCLIGLIIIIGMSTNYAYSQEIDLATFQESAQIIIDEKNISKKPHSQLHYQVLTFRKLEFQ